MPDFSNSTSPTTRNASQATDDGHDLYGLISDMESHLNIADSFAVAIESMTVFSRELTPDEVGAIWNLANEVRSELRQLRETWSHAHRAAVAQRRATQ